MAGQNTVRAVGWAGGIALSSWLALATTSAANRGPLVDHVRAANDRFKDVSVAMSEGYTPISCASGIDGCAMGIHYFNAKLIDSNAIDIKHPKAVMSEPMPNGKMLLIAVAQGSDAQLYRRPQSLRPRYFL